MTISGRRKSTRRVSLKNSPADQVADSSSTATSQSDPEIGSDAEPILEMNDSININPNDTNGNSTEFSRQDETTIDAQHAADASPETTDTETSQSQTGISESDPQLESSLDPESSLPGAESDSVDAPGQAEPYTGSSAAAGSSGSGDPSGRPATGDHIAGTIGMAQDEASHQVVPGETLLSPAAASGEGSTLPSSAETGITSDWVSAKPDAPAASPVAASLGGARWDSRWTTAWSAPATTTLAKLPRSASAYVPVSAPVALDEKPVSVEDPVEIPPLLQIPEETYIAEPVGVLTQEPIHIAKQESGSALEDPDRSDGEAPIFSFTFRAKSPNAPTPEQAAEQQTDWTNGSTRSGRIGRRSDVGRGGPGRHVPPSERASQLDRFARTSELGRPQETDGESTSDGLVTPADEWLEAVGETGSVLEATLEGGELTSGVGRAGEVDSREDRNGRTRRRKERGRGRRRDRNGIDSLADEAADLDDPLEDSVALGTESYGPSVDVATSDVDSVAGMPPMQDEELLAEAEALSRIGLDQRLGKEILVNTGARETRIAYVVGGMLTELHIEREERLVGAICKARVDRILPGIDAAFVDISLDRNAFLMAGDVTPEEDEDEPSQGRRPHRHLSISDLVKPRQEIMVQISKAPRGTKGARVATRVSLPGRYLVLMPDSETVGVSRKIDEDHERDRLKKIARSIRPPGFGVIVRTEAENKTEEELRNDVSFLLRLWQQIQQKYKAARAPSIVHRDLSLTFKIIRDLFGSDVNRFVIDSRDEWEKVVELVEFISPKLRSRVILYEDPVPLFERVGIEDEIERLFRHKVWLKSGGYLIIDETEALTTIDVNSGKFVGTTNPAQTIFKNNMESVVEICRQLRLRDIGGMIILDFIDMSNAKDRAAVMKALDASLKKDRSRTKIAHLSPLGLVEMTRKRTGETFSELTTELCSYCSGRGRTLNPDTVSILVEREIRKQGYELNDEAFLVMVNPAVAPYLIGPDAINVDRLEREMRRGVYVRATDNLHIEKFEVVPADIQEMERQLVPYREGQVVDCVVEQTPAINLPHAIARLDGYLVDLVNGGQYLGRRVRAKLTRVGRSVAVGEVVGGGRQVDKLGGI